MIPDVLPMSYVPRGEGPSDDLDDREFDVLAELAREREGRTAFQGLRRRLGLHQQALTRTLRRLERSGAISHDDSGYSLTGQGHAALRGRAPLATQGEILPVLQALLPPSVTAHDVADRLAKRWFRDLRWYGRSDAGQGTTLSWLTVDGGRMVRVRFASGMAVLEVEVPPGERLGSFPAAQSVLRALADLYSASDAQAA